MAEAATSTSTSTTLIMGAGVVVVGGIIYYLMKKVAPPSAPPPDVKEVAGTSNKAVPVPVTAFKTVSVAQKAVQDAIKMVNTIKKAMGKTTTEIEYENQFGDGFNSKTGAGGSPPDTPEQAEGWGKMAAAGAARNQKK